MLRLWRESLVLVMKNESVFMDRIAICDTKTLLFWWRIYGDDSELIE